MKCRFSLFQSNILESKLKALVPNSSKTTIPSEMFLLEFEKNTLSNKTIANRLQHEVNICLLPSSTLRQNVFPNIEYILNIYWVLQKNMPIWKSALDLLPMKNKRWFHPGENV